MVIVDERVNGRKKISGKGGRLPICAMRNVFLYFIEFLYKLMSTTQTVVTTYKNTIRKGETYDVLSIQRENGNGTKTLGRKRYLQRKKKIRNKNKRRTQILVR